MDLLIKNMELPKEDTLIVLSPDGTVTFMDHTTAHAVEISSHGRLIDSDELEKDGWHLQRYVRKTDWCWLESMMLNDAPTIIPASEGET